MSLPTTLEVCLDGLSANFYKYLSGLEKPQWVPAPRSFPRCFKIHALVLSVCLNYVAGMLVPTLSDPYPLA